jgi:hypothetical protein
MKKMKLELKEYTKKERAITIEEREELSRRKLFFHKRTPTLISRAGVQEAPAQAGKKKKKKKSGILV